MSQPPGTGWQRCQYFAFWDVPRALVVHHLGRTLLLESPFDEDLDDFTPRYSVWDLEPMGPELALLATWKEVGRRKRRQLEDLPVTALEFWPKRENVALQRFYVWYLFKMAGA